MGDIKAERMVLPEKSLYALRISFSGQIAGPAMRKWCRFIVFDSRSKIRLVTSIFHRQFPFQQFVEENLFTSNHEALNGRRCLKSS